MAFTEFCTRSGGSNLNAGTRTGNSTEPGTSADFTYATGNFVNSTGVFTVASGNPSSDGVAVGDFASIYNPLNALECYGSAASVSADCASTPDSAALSITGDIDIRVMVSLEDWSPSIQCTLAAKWNTTGNQRSWTLGLTTTGTLQLLTSSAGSAVTVTAASTANLSAYLPNQVSWVRATMDVDNGAAGNTVNFYTSTDGSSWSALGSAVTTAGTTAIFNSTAVVTLGNGTNNAALIGKIYKAEIYNGIAGTRVANPDFTAQSAGATSFADGDGNTWTVNSPAAIVATTATNFVGRVTARDTTTITVSTTAKAGPVPPDGTGVYTLKIGGAWKGPNAAEMFPFDFVQNTLTNSAGDYPRVNFKNAATYSITAAMFHTNTLCYFFGYTTSYGDGGRATFDGGTSGVSYVLLTTSSTTWLQDLIFQNNGATGSAAGLATGSNNYLVRVGINSVRGNGFSQSSGANTLIECETYACNQSNTANTAGFNSAQGSTFLRCIARDNTGSNTRGFRLAQPSRCIDCIADSNGGIGFEVIGTAALVHYLDNCDSYNNGGAGIAVVVTSASAVVYIENCNLIKNGGYGIDAAITLYPVLGAIVNCGFGSGTQANTSGTINGSQIPVSGTVTYPTDTTPWVDPAGGDFRINSQYAMNAGRGTFPPGSTTVGYPDIGTAQSRKAISKRVGFGGGLVA